MGAITLKQVPDDLHRAIKRIQLDLEDDDIRLTLEEIYIDLLQRGLKDFRTEKAAK